MKNGEEHVRNIGSAEHDYLSADWYKQAKSLEDGEGFWTEPYLDEVGGKDKLCSFLCQSTIAESVWQVSGDPTCR
jgi:hypothetical protein